MNPNRHPAVSAPSGCDLRGAGLSVCVLRGDATAFRGFTFSPLAGKLPVLADPWLAVGAWQGGAPIGLALGDCYGRHAYLLSLMVNPLYRGRGIGTQLLEAWEAEALRLGAATCSAKFSEGLPQRPAFSRLLARRGWTNPETLFFRLAGFAGRMGREGGAWLGVRRRILGREDIGYAPFALRAEDDGAIDRLLARPEAKSFRDPRTFAGRFVSETSIAVRREGELIGWIIAQPGRAAVAETLGHAGATVIDYKECYLDPALWSAGLALGGFYHCFLAQAAAFGEDSIAMYTTHPGVPKMVAFSRRRFAPMALSFDTVLRSEKSLAPETTA